MEMTRKDELTPVYEDGVLVGWYDWAFLSGKPEQSKVFIPRRDEDIEADRIALDPEHPANWEN